jgi:hypothetical protein
LKFGKRRLRARAGFGRRRFPQSRWALAFARAGLGIGGWPGPLRRRHNLTFVPEMGLGAWSIGVVSSGNSIYFRGALLMSVACQSIRSR